MSNSIIRVSNLTKKYPEFTLNNISLNIEQGKIVGLIGRNGAGKTTLIKSLLGIIPYDGNVTYFDGVDTSLAKEDIGYASGGFDFYSQKKLSTISKCVLSFYKNADYGKFLSFADKFNLSLDKKVCQLSEGMKVKFSIALSLSHGAKILILDEPTSGLDPISREEFCDIILEAVRFYGVTVLFSTHITSDLEKIADEVAFLSDGELLFHKPLAELLSKYALIHVEDISACDNLEVIGLKQVKSGYEGLILKENAPKNIELLHIDIDKIMVHFEYDKEGRKCLI